MGMTGWAAGFRWNDIAVELRQLPKNQGEACILQNQDLKCSEILL
jgi:hypothetical protein